MSLGNPKKSTSTLEDILRDAKIQSQAVDDFLKTSDDPTVNSIRMSLESFKHSIVSNRDVGRPSSSKNDSWGYKAQDFGANNANSSGMRDSMFMPANKVKKIISPFFLFNLRMLSSQSCVRLHYKVASVFGRDQHRLCVVHNSFYFNATLNTSTQRFLLTSGDGGQMNWRAAVVTRLPAVKVIPS